MNSLDSSLIQSVLSLKEGRLDNREMVREPAYVLIAWHLYISVYCGENTKDLVKKNSWSAFEESNPTLALE